MKFLDDKKIGTKLIGSYLIIVVLLIMLAYVGFSSLDQEKQVENEVYLSNLLPIDQLHTINSDVLFIRGDIIRYYLYPGERKDLDTSIAENTADIETHLAQYKTQDLLPDEKKLLSDFESSWSQYKKEMALYFDNIKSGNTEAANQSLSSNGNLVTMRTQMSDTLEKIIALSLTQAEKLDNENDALVPRTEMMIIIITIITAVFAFGLGLIITRSITIPLGRGVHMMQEMSFGHLGTRLNLGRKDEVGVLANAMDSFSEDLQNSIVAGLKKISAGDLSVKVIPKDDRDEISPAMVNMVDTLQALVSEAVMLSQAAIDGKLSTRGDVSRFQGGYRQIVEGVNKTLDAVILPVNEAMRLAGRFADRDFSARIDPNLVVKGDFDKFKAALDEIGISVSGAVELIQRQVSELVAAAEEANASIEEIGAGSTQIAQNASKVSVNAEGSEQGISQVLQAMEDLSQTVSQVSTRTDQVAKLSMETEQLTRKGAELAGNAERGMDGIITSSQEIGTIITDIKDQMEDIGRIVGIIGDIADQTNLLALNAAIEAARAGEAGLGFAVVADEVKALALEVQKSAENIATIITNLQKKSETASGAMKSSHEDVKKGSAAVTETLKVFTDIVTAIGQISTNVADVASATEEQAASVEEVTSSMHEISKMAEDTAKEATDAAAASEEASAAIDQISQVVAGVSRNVQQIAGEMDKFTV